jgi:hypothetical protein
MVPLKVIYKHTTRVVSLIPVQTFEGVRRWFPFQIRRNINEDSRITEYHFGVGFMTVRPRAKGE